jgi:hypothetical protein
MDVVFQVRPSYVLVQVAGKWDVARARSAFEEVVRRCDERGFTRILVDGTGIETPIPISDRYDLATLFAAISGGRMRMSLRMATENMFSKTFENTAANRGLHVRSTDSLQEALAFLQLPAPE